MLLYVSSINAQSKIDTIFYDKKYIKVSKQNAELISIQVQKDSFLTVTTYNISMQIRSKIDYRVRNMGSKKEYNVIYGDYINYHDNGQLKTKATVKNGDWHGSLMSYYDNGKPIRIETYENDSLIKSECMDKQGNKIPYFPYQVNPEFNGGSANMFKYLSMNIEYPRKARENGVEGTVFVGFVVDIDGSLDMVSVKRGVSKELDAESVRVVKSMPKWKPGLIEGEPIRVAYTLPIKFKFENPGTDGLLNTLFKKKKKKED